LKKPAVGIFHNSSPRKAKRLERKSSTVFNRDSKKVKRLDLPILGHFLYRQVLTKKEGDKSMSAVLKANERTGSQRSALRQLRQEGNIPAVVYGKNKESQSIYVDGIEFIKTIRENGRNGVISLDINGNKQNVMLTDYHQDHVKNEILHADFLLVDKSSKVNASVRVNLVGEAAGVKDGGVMQQPVHEVNITATPGSIPQSIDVDITNLQVNENLTLADIKTGNYEINDDENTVVVSILPPKVEEEINSGEEQEPGEPENEEGRETKASEE
jgi:large subunit ribosomal protein L25